MAEIEEAIDLVLKRLEALEDKQQIRDAIEAYPRGADRGDPSAIRAIAWPEAVFPDVRPGTLQDFAEELFGGQIGELFVATQHMMGNSIIDVQGRVAFAETYAIAHHRSHPRPECNETMLGKSNFRAEDAAESHQLIVGIRYIDRFEKREWTWKISSRRIVLDWSSAGLYAGIDKGGLYDLLALRGRRDRGDQCYARGIDAAAKPR